MITDLPMERESTAPWALRRRRSARVKPPMPSAPTLRKSRREMWSQSFPCWLPQMVNIGPSREKGFESEGISLESNSDCVARKPKNLWDLASQERQRLE